MSEMTMQHTLGKSNPQRGSSNVNGVLARESLEALDIWKDDLIAENLGLVDRVVWSLRSSLPKHIDNDELKSAGYFGLVDAATKYDAARHIQFASYAQFRVRGAILDSLRQDDWSPRQLRRKAREIEEGMRCVEQRLQRPGTDAEIAAELGMPVREYRTVLQELRSLELQIERAAEDDVEGGSSDLEQFAGPSDDGALSHLLQSEMVTLLQEALETLPERERLVITLTYLEEMTLREVGLALGIGEARVSQIRSSAILRLRSLLGATSGATTGAPVSARSIARRDQKRSAA